jgi:hypothetical protein
MAAVLAYMVEVPPVNRVIEPAGPESLPIAEFVVRYLAASGDTRTVVADPQARYFGASLDNGGLTPGATRQGVRTRRGCTGAGCSPWPFDRRVRLQSCRRGGISLPFPFPLPFRLCTNRTNPTNASDYFGKRCDIDLGASAALLADSQKQLLAHVEAASQVHGMHGVYDFSWFLRVRERQRHVLLAGFAPRAHISLPIPFRRVTRRQQTLRHGLVGN